jgi:hypothetical protein
MVPILVDVTGPAVRTRGPMVVALVEGLRDQLPADAASRSEYGKVHVILHWLMMR